MPWQRCALERIIARRALDHDASDVDKVEASCSKGGQIAEIASIKSS